MNAAASRVETKVIAEDRIARIESDVAEIKDDVKTINVRLNDSIVANAREFGSLRADTEKRFGALMVALESNKTESEKNFGSLRTETEKSFASFRAETEKSFGAVRVEIEKVRTSIVSAKLWMLLISIGTLGSLLMGILNFVSHTSRIP